MTPLALDTSVAVPLLVRTHRAHAEVVRWWGGRDIALAGHALAETYSVLTRLPADLRVAPPDAARLLGERFAAPLLLPPETAGSLPEVLARLGVAGGAVYDALVALAARSTMPFWRPGTPAPGRPTTSWASASSSPAEFIKRMADKQVTPPSGSWQAPTTSRSRRCPSTSGCSPTPAWSAGTPGGTW